MGVAGFGLEHAVFLRDVRFDVRDGGEFDLDVLHAFLLKLFFDRSQPSDVVVLAVDGQADQLTVECFEIAGPIEAKSSIRSCKRV